MNLMMGFESVLSRVLHEILRMSASGISCLVTVSGSASGLMMRSCILARLSGDSNWVTLMLIENSLIGVGISVMMVFDDRVVIGEWSISE